MKNIINNLLSEGRLTEDSWVIWGEKKIQIVKNSTDGKIYVYNPETKRAASYIEGIGGVGGYKPVSIGSYNSIVSLLKKRLEAKKAQVEREKIAAWKKAHNEGDNGQKPQVVDNSAVNAPASTVAVRLDAEREDSKFDYRRSEEIFSRSEAEAYEDLGGFFEDEEGIISLGHHKAVYLKSEVERARTYVGRDGQTYEQKAYLKMTFEVEGKEFTTRAYRPQFNSFKIQANQKFHGIFAYTKESQALEELVGKTFDIWVVYNDMIRELQADFYDKAAYAARKAEQAKAGFVRGGYGRPTENKATR